MKALRVRLLPVHVHILMVSGAGPLPRRPPGILGLLGMGVLGRGGLRVRVRDLLLVLISGAGASLEAGLVGLVQVVVLALLILLLRGRGVVQVRLVNVVLQALAERRTGPLVGRLPVVAILNLFLLLLRNVVRTIVQVLAWVIHGLGGIGLLAGVVGRGRWRLHSGERFVPLILGLGAQRIKILHLQADVTLTVLAAVTHVAAGRALAARLGVEAGVVGRAVWILLRLFKLVFLLLLKVLLVVPSSG